jgi:light-regulated signal transduction histidine kinase (bacteriophytochrome)
MFQTLSRRDDVKSIRVGLIVVKKIVEMHGERIWIESKVGEGSVFLFTLPKQMERVKDEKLEASIV